jgi:hypothetical protein
MPSTGNETGTAGGRRYRPDARSEPRNFPTGSYGVLSRCRYSLKLRAESTLSVGSDVRQDVQRDRARMPDRPASRNGASHLEP